MGARLLSRVENQYREVYSGGEDVEAEYCFDGCGEGCVWAVVVGVEDAPGFEVGDGLFDGPSELVDLGVVVPDSFRHGFPCWFLLWGGHSAPGVAFVGDELGWVSSFEDGVGVERCDIVGVAREWVGDPQDVTGHGADDLEGDPGGVVFPGVRLGMGTPRPAGHQRSIDQQGGVGGDLLEGGDQVGQDLGHGLDE